MIPSEIASRLQLGTDAAVPRVPTTQQVSDALADLVPGQRVLAEIQSLLPNGAYRALINQRDVTLALPFSAKAGDSLELEVVDNDGKLTLAVVARRGGQSEAAAGGERPAVETSLSRTASFISDLLPRRERGEQAQPALLNANQPIAAKPPTNAADLVPLLKQAIAQSGMFYEAHQSQWVTNARPLETLLNQPQGRHSALVSAAPQDASALPDSAARREHTSPLAERGPAAPATGQEKVATAGAEPSLRTGAALLQQAGQNVAPPVAPDLLPIVQQQLEALATQTYVWQGQAWPGQPMQWEIVEEDGSRQAGSEVEAAPWQTRLTLTMPQLGEVRAALRFVGGEVTLSLSAASGEAAVQLANGGDALRQQLEAAGLALGGFTVGRHESRPE
ncbi:MAG: flagellar hook-length control protein FliK [Rhodocyclales bacterium]|nr:flagellar hook-length control protein FliK [Rhodocyclales bacterium]